MTKTNSKIIRLQDLKYLQRLFQGKKMVLVGGCFDLLHYGHYSFLKNAKEIGDCLIVVLESDEFIVKQKMRKPVHSQSERAEILAGLRIVDWVITIPYFSSDKDYEDLVKKIHPDIIAVTRNDPQIENKKRQAALINGKLKVVIPLLRGFSTQKIIQALL